MKEAKHDLTEFDNAMSEFLPHVADRFCPQCGQPVDKNPIGRPGSSVLPPAGSGGGPNIRNLKTGNPHS